jgi:hypothetical protein
MTADSHVDEHDVLAVRPADIDELTGIEGICQILPADWLQVLSENSVKLPGFHTHNGTTAKNKANGAERQRRYRSTHKRHK